MARNMYLETVELDTMFHMEAPSKCNVWQDTYVLKLYYIQMTTKPGDTKTTWRMPRELLKDLKRYALEYDTSVTAVVWRACREFLARDKMFKDRYQSDSGLKTMAKEDSVQLQSAEEYDDDEWKEMQSYLNPDTTNLSS